MRSKRGIGLVVALGLLATALSVVAAGRDDEPERVVVQHILIGYKKSVPNKPVERTKKEAKELALELEQRARDGEDFDALVKEYTNDSYPGIYGLINEGGARGPGDFRRRDMATRFGDVAFELEVGEIGLAQYHAAMSPYGWHIIKRLE